MRYDRLHDFINTWFLWIGLHVLSCTFGILLGEAIGQWVAQSVSLQAGHAVAFLIFEGAIWLARRAVFRFVPFDRMWTTFTQMIWVVTEVLGWSLGTQVLTTSAAPQLTGGAVFALAIGAALWFLLWCARLARPGRWWFLVATVYAIVGLLIGNIVIVFALVVRDEVYKALLSIVPPILAIAATGVLIGLVIGGLTGVVVARQVAVAAGARATT